MFISSAWAMLFDKSCPKRSNSGNSSLHHPLYSLYISLCIPHWEQIGYMSVLRLMILLVIYPKSATASRLVWITLFTSSWSFFCSIWSVTWLIAIVAFGIFLWILIKDKSKVLNWFDILGHISGLALRGAFLWWQIVLTLLFELTITKSSLPLVFHKLC